MRKRVPAFALITFTLLFRALAAEAQNFSLSLDADSSVGDQEAASVTTSPDRIVAIQIFGSGINLANGISVYLEYDASDVTYERFDAGGLFPNQQVFEETGTNPTYVGIAVGALGGQTTVDSGLLGTVHFRTAASFTGASIRLVRSDLNRSGEIESATLSSTVTLALESPTPPPTATPGPASSDFNGDRMVTIDDFFLFADAFGGNKGDGSGKYAAKYDLDGDEAIGFSDFFIFAENYGKPVPPDSTEPPDSSEGSGPTAGE